MVEAMDKVLSQIEAQHGSIDEFVKTELGYDTIAETYQALAAEQMDSVAMAIYQMKQEQALIIGDQTGVGKGRQMAALIRWAVQRGEKPVFITQKADLFSDIYRDLVDVGSGDLVPFIFTLTVLWLIAKVIQYTNLYLPQKWQKSLHREHCPKNMTSLYSPIRR